MRPEREKDGRNFDRINRITGITGIMRENQIEATPSLSPESAARFRGKALRFCNPVNPVKNSLLGPMGIVARIRPLYRTPLCDFAALRESSTVFLFCSVITVPSVGKSEEGARFRVAGVLRRQNHKPTTPTFNTGPATKSGGIPPPRAPGP